MKKLKNHLNQLLFLLLLINFNSQAQVKIGSNATALQEGSILELEANGNKAGFKIAEIALTSIIDTTTLPVQEISKGTLVWNTATAGTAPNNVTPGFYIWMGTKWEKILSSASGNTKTIYDGNGKIASNRTIEMDTLSLAFTSAATNGTSHFSVDGTTFNVNAADNRVGIGNANPMATLDVAGNPTNTTSPDGVIVPRITRAQLIAKTAYGTNQTGAMIYITDLSGTVNAQTANVTTTGLYFFNGTVWQKVIQDSVANSYMFVRSTSQQPTMALNSNVKFNIIDSQQGDDISVNFSTNVFTLKAGKTYKLTGVVPWAVNTWAQFAWFNITSNVEIGSRGHVETNSTTFATAYITPIVDTQVAFRFVRQGGSVTVGDTFAGGAQASAIIEVISSTIPVTGVTSQYLTVSRTGTDQNVSAGQDIILNNTVGGNIPYNTSTGIVTLTAGNTYKFDVGLTAQNINISATYALVDANSNVQLSQLGELLAVTVGANNHSSPLVFTYTPTTNQTVKLRMISSSATIRSNLSSTMSITQIGTTNASQFVGMMTNSYDVGTTYPSGTIIVKDGLLYQANSTIVAGTPFSVGNNGNTFKLLSKEQEVESTVNNLVSFTNWGLNVRYNHSSQQFEWMLATPRFVKRTSSWSMTSSFSQLGGGSITTVANTWYPLWTDSSLSLALGDQEYCTFRIADSALAMSVGNYEEYEVTATVGSGGTNNNIRINKKK